MHVGPKIVFVPLQSNFKYNYYVCLHLEDYHAVYTHCIGRIHSLATTSGLVRKMGVISIMVRTSESKDHVYRRENLASIAIKQIQCLHALVAQNNLRTSFLHS